MAVARAVWGFIEQRDLQLMRRLHRWRAPRPIRILMLMMTRLGNGWLWYSLGIFVLVGGGQNRYRAFFAGALSALTAILIFQRVKPLSHRRRPCEIEPHCWAAISPPDRFSFPSGHAMTSFAIAIAVGSFYPQCQPCLLAVAAMIAVSRIIVGMHFLTDIIAGALIGALIGYLSVWLFL
jgi:undecaprenyl-diphosphatase